MGSYNYSRKLANVPSRSGNDTINFLIGTIIGTIIGLLTGVIRTIPVPEHGAKKGIFKSINVILSIYIEFFRGTPMIVQAMVIYYGSALAFGMDMDRFCCSDFYCIH